ncbi:MAG TPA: isocitrate lyase/phosphoenolpyruvate mutase family protein [Mucilaginibacter sp.]|nr:isocitrate lyase/phosphoenolpyruvate mutase family protein [Mucilaginibacter sp.]
MSTTQTEKAELFRSLHARNGVFVIPNPWDAGSAKILAGLGFEALATTSAGLAFSLGKPDGEGAITRSEALRNAHEIAMAVSIPVSADLENGYGHEPEICAETVFLAAENGLAGCSIEDNNGNRKDPIYEFDHAVERIKAAVQAARGLPFPFTLTARAENLICGRPDLKDTIRRLEAYADAGADVLFAPGLRTKDEIKAVVRAVAPKPVNVVLGLGQTDMTVSELGDLGVKRISLGSSLARAAYGAFMQAADEVVKKGTFNFTLGTTAYGDFNDLFRK